MEVLLFSVFISSLLSTDYSTSVNYTDADLEAIQLIEEIALSEEAAWPAYCTTSCDMWTYQTGFDYGCSITHWPSSDVNETVDYYIHTCGCFNYAVGIPEGYAYGLQASGNPGRLPSGNCSGFFQLTMKGI